MYRRPYLESSVFIAYIKGEMKEGNHDCKAIVDSILASAGAGDFSIYTSALTIAEVYRSKRKGSVITDEENEDLRPYFRESYIKLIEVDRDIAERANDFCRFSAPRGIPALRPNDAIHLASAERAGCDVLLTYDSDLTQQPHETIRIEWPSKTLLIEFPIQLALTSGEPNVQEQLVYCL